MSTVTDINEARSALNYAQRYIRLGWWVLPLDPGTKKPLGRLVHNGFHDATNDADTATKWWTQHPEAGVGIALRKSGLVAIDIDPRNGGIETIDHLESQHGPIVSDVLALTGGGGEHRVFAAQLVEGLPGTLGAGVDLKADGYIAVEPTLHPSGKRYGWDLESDPLDGVVPSTLPNWIRDLSRGKALSLPATACAAPPVPAHRLASAQAALAHLTHASRDIWVAVGQAIHNEMPTQEGFTLWDAWSQTNGGKYDAQDQFRVWRSFTRKGLAGVGLNTLFLIAQKAGWVNAGPAVEAKSVLSTAGLVLNMAELNERAAAIRWAVKGIIPEGGIGFIYGASQAFKSFITLDYALHRAYGLKWMGRKTRKAVPVYLAAEGGAGLLRRLQAWHKARSMDWTKCPMRVVIVPLTLRTQAAVLREAIQAVNLTPGDVIVDTLSQTFTGNENSNDEVADFLRVLGTELRDALSCTVLIVHHTGHAAERMRGASALLNNTDFVLSVQRDGKELLASVDFEKIKDADRGTEPQTFELSVQKLGVDEDGDDITSLSARHIDNAEELIAAFAREGQAGRGGNNNLLLQLVQNGMPEKELRRVFYDELGTKDPDTKRKAFNRALSWVIKGGFIEVAQGIVIVLKEVS